MRAALAIIETFQLGQVCTMGPKYRPRIYLWINGSTSRCIWPTFWFSINNMLNYLLYSTLSQKYFSHDITPLTRDAKQNGAIVIA